MYGVQGRTWVALGDPVGPAIGASESDPACSSSGATTSAACRCSTRSAPTHLHLYADFGLTSSKLGEEAHGRPARASRWTAARGQVPPGIAPARKRGRNLPRHRPRRCAGADCPRCAASRTTGSRRRAAAEKGFSLGFFDEAYLSPLSGRRLERAGGIRGVRQHLAGPGTRGTLGRPDALHATRRRASWKRCSCT